MEEKVLNCGNCLHAQDWCCAKKKAKGMITCMNPKHEGPPMELKKETYCKNHEVKED